MAVRVNVYGKADMRQIEKARAELDKLAKSAGAPATRLQRLSGVATKYGKQLKIGLALGAAAFVKLSLAAEKSTTADARIRQINKSMGLFGNTSEEVNKRLIKLAETTARNTGVDTNSIKATQAKLLTFKELAATADVVGGAFDRTTQAAIDLAAAGFGEAEQNAVQLGKALNDPVKGLTALGRAGVTFTEQEKDKIKALVESGNMLEAQNTLLRAIEGQVGGTAVATANASDKMKVAFTQTSEKLGKLLLPTFEKLTGGAMELMDSFDNLPDPVKKAGVGVGLFGTAALVALPYALKLKDALDKIGLTSVAGKAGLVGLAAAAAVLTDGFIKNSDSAVAVWIRELDLITSRKTLAWATKHYADNEKKLAPYIKAVADAEDALKPKSEKVKAISQQMASAQRTLGGAFNDTTGEMLDQVDAEKELHDAGLSLREANLSQKRAVLEHKDAHAALQKLQKSGKASARELTDAQLALEDAEIGLIRANDRVAEATEKSSAAQATAATQAATKTTAAAEKMARDYPAIIRKMGDTAALEAYQAGKDVSLGMRDGMDDYMPKVKVMATILGRAVPNWMRQALRSDSPSKETRDIGRDTTEGFRLGLGDKARKLERTAYDVAMIPPVAFGGTQSVSNSSVVNDNRRYTIPINAAGGDLNAIKALIERVLEDKVRDAYALGRA